MRCLANLLRRRMNHRRRNIFQFFDGARLRRIDPAAVVRSLDSNTEFDWENDPGQIAFGDDKALNRTVAAVQRAFGVHRYNETSDFGLTESETVELLIQFTQYLESQKKSGSGLLILPTSTASKSSADTSTMKPSSDSGSTSKDNNSETASQST